MISKTVLYIARCRLYSPTSFPSMCCLAHIRPKVIYRTNDIHIIKNMVAENLGISFLTKLVITPNDRLADLSLADS
ncbi:hypothetical protein [Limosilactobacillus fastidiosus]|uniref:Uncharacterized protein n=1 Tax=Limosilactobacillus fastidiosus TaxID=2759855 RepID=A0A7W3U053_9LACO|nr:hypothetical protein [Limosilactobacillus fastidiosus]MBB1062897.1 hypothetical protein [Limosilactobacillus fastidiosus]MBB1086434.1 hypothetical protein [Limosilactobacillus fastidiosus]MCD7083743.1 hypothetical protein [Limosilactobacillus fastidiosus]MCD7086313.1 hypothetical protein [Limosilactobacillus fastidiosus]MCD7114906.1 hypothetical protein [Limosilactobacillus fastidiosus]